MVAIALATAPAATTLRIPVGYDFVCDVMAKGRQTKVVQGRIDASYDVSKRSNATSLSISAGPEVPAIESAEAFVVGDSVTASVWNGSKERYLFAVNVPPDRSRTDGTIRVSREVFGDPSKTSIALVGICEMTKRGDF